MELWEGVILVAGGLWLVGRMSRNSKTHPVSKAMAASAGTASGVGTVGPQGNTVATNTDGSTSLIAGEPLTPIANPIAVPKQVNVNKIATPIVKSPLIGKSGGVVTRNFNL
jgi:hypothetical protein